MTAPRPVVDINLFFHNEADHLEATICSVLDQTWQDWRLTLIDDGSTDGSREIAERWAGRDRRIALKRFRANQGIVSGFRAAFLHGDAEFVMPKSGDDLLAPTFIEEIMAVLEDPDVAMCHAGAVVIDGNGTVITEVPAETRLATPEGDAIARAAHVMATYTFASSFWGIYRRSAVDRALGPLPCGGWDHAFLADIALHGRILHVPKVLFFRRDGPAPLHQLARNASLAWSRARSADDLFDDFGALAPYTTCLWAHLETFALARLPEAQRAALIELAREMLTARWAHGFNQERDALLAALPRLICRQDDGIAAGAAGVVLRQRSAVRLLLEVNAWATGDGSVVCTYEEALREAA